MTVAQQEWATVQTPGGRIDLQAVDRYLPPGWPGQDGSALVHLDFLVDDLQAAAHRVTLAGAKRMGFQPNQEHCLVFADPVGNPFCLTL